MESSYAYMARRHGVQERSRTNAREMPLARIFIFIFRLFEHRTDVLTYGALVDALFCSGGPG